jgi:polysaccharide biosynthesis protein PslG
MVSRMHGRTVELARACDRLTGGLTRTGNRCVGTITRSGGRRVGRLAGAYTIGLCAAALFAPVAQAGSTGRADSSAGAPLGGVNITAPVLGDGASAPIDHDIALAHALHAAVVRTEVPWSALEPNGPGQIDQAALRSLDRLMSDAAANGIRVIVFVDSTPCWASSAPAALLRRCVDGASSKANAWPPTNPAYYASFVSYLAGRYGPQLAALEVWNEPDQINEAYFAGPEKAQRYAAILRAAYPAIKQADPSVPVLAGSLVGYNGVFLRALYAAGIKGYYDGIAVHFYSLTLASLRSFRAVQAANGDTKPLWLDEFGWSSCWPKYRIQAEQACVTPQIQARNIRDMFLALSHTPYLAADVLYKLQSTGPESFGVVSPRGAHRPGFAALKRVLESPVGAPSPVTLRLRRRGNRILASGSGPVGDYIRLEAFQGITPRFRAQFTLDRFDRYSLALPSVLGTRGLRVRVYQEWLGSRQATQKTI